MAVTSEHSALPSSTGPRSMIPVPGGAPRATNSPQQSTAFFKQMTSMPQFSLAMRESSRNSGAFAVAALFTLACSNSGSADRTDFRLCSGAAPTCLPGDYCAGATGDARGANKWRCLPIEDASQFVCRELESASAPGGAVTLCEPSPTGRSEDNDATNGPPDGGPGGGYRGS